MQFFRLFLPLVLFVGLASGQTIVRPADAPANVQLAAKEIRRYVYLRTGKLLPIAESGNGIALRIDPALGAQEYRIASNGISGGSDVGVLYGAYRYAELLGVRFYLHGDVIPDGRLKDLPVVKDEVGKPLFETRGIQPFHDFMEGPDWWNTDDYKAYVSQLVKLRMNFMGLHNYPERGGEWPGPELTVWIGLPGDADKRGRVSFGYPAFFANTQRPGWGNDPTATSAFSGGAAELFASDDYGPDVQAGHFPWPKEPADCLEVFNRTADMYQDVFGFARSLGIRICVGTETPLTIPQRVRERLKEQGKDATSPAVVKELYTGMFQRIQRAFPVDYYWLWTPEDWSWSGNNPAQFEATKRDVQAALGALDDLGHPFTLATSGWVLGPVHDRAALDELLPKTSPMSCINRLVGHDGVEPAFANIAGRPKWAIPWLENDPNMVGPQPWVARMRHDAVDARRFGCTGLLGIHWRVNAMAQNIAALAAAAWDQSWVPASYNTDPVLPTKGGEGAVGGNTIGFNAPVGGTPGTPQAVYQDVRYSLTGYRLTVPDGTYTVTLQFNEPAYNAAGKRVFGAKIQGKTVLEHLDVFARSGSNKALNLGFPNIIVAGGTLNLEFTKEVDLPCIAGIVIEGKTKASNQIASEAFTRKINCGGAKVGDYEADRVSGGSAAPSPRNRAMPVEDFYIDFVRANFGDAVADPVGKLFARIDGVAMPEVSAWGPGPGGLAPNGTPWESVSKRFAFVDELASMRQQVQGAGNHERFDYWLNTYRSAATMAEVSCLRGRLDLLMADKKFNDALAARIELAAAWTRLMTLQTSLVSSPGELGTIANLEQQTRRRKQFIEGHDAALVKAIGKPLPPAAEPGKIYQGPSKIIVPCVRNVVTRNESLTLKIIALDPQAVKSVSVRVRPLGSSAWQSITANHLGRAVWQAKLPAATEDFEYHVIAEGADGRTITWPATAPETNQTVVVSGS